AFFFQAEDGIRDFHVTGVQTCALPILREVGLGYITLERGTPSLSAGEARRLRLASLLSSGLTGVLYVLDEPTIGLHPRDNARLEIGRASRRGTGSIAGAVVSLKKPTDY